MWTKGDKAKPDAQLARIAARQHGLITRSQLADAGLLSSGIAVRLDSGRLHRIHRGVYAVGHAALGNEGRWLAAVLAHGAGAVLSHRSAAALWGIVSSSDLVEVTVPGGGGRARRSGIRLHRSQTLSPADVTLRSGIPVTRPTRTLDDLRRVLHATKFAAALRQAEFLRLPLGDLPTDHTRSELEARFLSLLRRRRLPQPEVNVPVDQFVVDFLGRAELLVVELYGWGAHRSRSAFEADRDRDARLKVLGYEVLRFTWRQVTGSSDAVAATVARLLIR
ncbi:MAG TPA: type IV toxin-antitoxin system AbiEi family antitoxin domain-containing protein [Solirubrobacterales bacterium]